MTEPTGAAGRQTFVTTRSGLTKLSSDDIVVIVFTIVGLLGGVILLFFTAVPPIVVSLFLATGICALVHRFLERIQGSFAVGNLKLAGVMAALVGSTLWINHELVPQIHMRLLSDDDMVGEWRWVYAKGAWEGHLNFFKDKGGQLHFTGVNARVLDVDKGIYQRVFDLDNGNARLEHGNQLYLEADVFDHDHNDHFRWKSTAPFPLLPAFRGEFSAPDRKDLDPLRWGATFYKWPQP